MLHCIRVATDVLNTGDDHPDKLIIADPFILTGLRFMHDGLRQGYASKRQSYEFCRSGGANVGRGAGVASPGTMVQR